MLFNIDSAQLWRTDLSHMPKPEASFQERNVGAADSLCCPSKLTPSSRTRLTLPPSLFLVNFFHDERRGRRFKKKLSVRKSLIFFKVSRVLIDVSARGHM